MAKSTPINVFQNGCKSIEDAILKHGFPITLQIYRKHRCKNLTTALESNYSQVEEPTEHALELHCVQSCQEIPTLSLVNNLGEEYRVQTSSMVNASYIPICNDKIFESFEEIYEHFQRNKARASRWMVSLTVDSSSSGVLIQAGQIFKVISVSNGSRCFKKKQKRLKIQLYPNNETFYLSTTVRGDFRSCHSPKSAKRNDISTIIQGNKLPILVKQEGVEEFSCLYGTTKEKCLITCTEDYLIYVFPSKDALLRDVHLDIEPCDRLSKKELQTTLEKALTGEQYQRHFIGKYSSLDIYRRPKAPLPPTPGAPSEYCWVDGAPTGRSVSKDGTTAEVAGNFSTEAKVAAPMLSYTGANRGHENVDGKIKDPGGYAGLDAARIRDGGKAPGSGGHNGYMVMEKDEDPIIPPPKPKCKSPIKKNQQADSKIIKNNNNIDKTDLSTLLVNNAFKNSPTGNPNVTPLPPVPRRDARLIQNQLASLPNGHPKKNYKGYICTPILNDPDDTDPEEEEENTQDYERGGVYKYDSDNSFDSDLDYENEPRIQINEYTRKNGLPLH